MTKDEKIQKAQAVLLSAQGDFAAAAQAEAEAYDTLSRTPEPSRRVEWVRRLSALSGVMLAVTDAQAARDAAVNALEEVEAVPVVEAVPDEVPPKVAPTEEIPAAQ